MKQNSVANVSAISTAPGFSFCQLNSLMNGNKSPKEFSQGSDQNTRRNSRENFRKKLFNERPQANKLSYKLKQSSDFDDNDRHFSLDESRLQGSKSRKLSDCMDVNDPKKLRNASFQGIDFLQNTPSTIKNKGDPSLKYQQTSNGNQKKQVNGNKQYNSALEELDSPEYFNNNNRINKSTKGLVKDKDKLEMKIYQKTETMLQYNNQNDIENNLERQVGSNVIEMGNGHNPNNINLFESARDSEANQKSQMIYNSVGEDAEPLQSGLLLRSVFFLYVLSVIVSLATYSQGNVFIFTFVNTTIYGLSFSLLLIYMITSHPFFKLTNELAVDIFTIPKFSYFGFIICLSCIVGYIFGQEKMEFRINIFNGLPILTILSFFLFCSCISPRQPILYKRLKLTYGRDKDQRTLTLSQSKVMRKGMTQQKLPQNLNNFLPDEQGPIIKSIQFYSSMILVILLLIAQIYYTFNQRQIWSSRIENNFYYTYAMIFFFLVLGEIMAGVIYKIDSYFGLEFKYELEFIRSIFAVSLFHLFYLMIPSIKVGIFIPLIKVVYKILMYYIYPTNYETIKTFLRRSVMRCFKDKQVEFKEMQRRLFTKKLGIFQFTDFISLLIFVTVLSLFRFGVSLDNDYTLLDHNEYINITILCMIEFVAEGSLTVLVINFLSKNSRFKGLTITKILKEINQFLVDGWYMTIFASLSVFAAISICISNNYLKCLEFKTHLTDHL